MSWTPPFDPEDIDQIQDWAENKRMRPLKKARLSIALLSLACLLGLVISSAPALCYWATAIIITMAGLFLFDRYGIDYATARVIKKTRKHWGDHPRRGVPGEWTGARLHPTVKETPAGQVASGVGIWRIKQGHWQQSGWNNTPQWFESRQQADSFAGMIDL